MKILRIEPYALILPIKEIYGGAAGNLEDCRTLIIRLEAEGGVEGWGEATQGRPGNTYETLETMEIMVRKYFAPALLGMELGDTGSVLRRLHQVRFGHPLTKAAMETALFDALGRHFGIPVCRFFAGPCRTEIDLVGGIGLDLGPEAAGAHAERLKREGYRFFKIKIGSEDDDRDVARVRAVREAVGEEAGIRVDGNACYSFVAARQLLSELKRFRISDAEQPLARGDLKSLAELRRSVGVPIAAQESVGSPEDALRLLEENGADLLKIKLTHIGGFHRALEVAAIVAARGLPVVVGQGSACTTILSAAEMHLHAALRNGQPGGEMTGFLRLSELRAFAPIEVRQGKALLPQGAGLGISVDLDEVRKLASSR